MLKFSLAAAGALIALSAAPAPAQTQGPQDVRVNQLIIYGNDACPASTENEIIVCAKRPEEDRYRIPENLREGDDARNNAWTNRVEELSYVGRSGTGSCSPTGPGGWTGCFGQLLNQARLERENRDEIDWNRLIEEARQERLGRIDTEAAQVEADIKAREEENARPR
ncbi:hypothetical protein IC614_07435 [Allosphingosinicella flava]|uniref:Secreted protein n=1 Tax=Allosphingosinicella flava TaxID=2771430 RepID=A0A7T2GIK4_9SPHN|nr:hypothetical protein [Sphingosinicella flava]QPQ54198.1 hypothetical protein IC614_07435 [Sphingosinicella flava]